MGYFPPDHPWGFIIYFVFFAIPLYIIAFYFGVKDGFIGVKTKAQRITLVFAIIIFVWYTGLHAYMHFGLPYIGVY